MVFSETGCYLRWHAYENLAIFQANERNTRELGALSPAYTLPEQNYKSLIMAKNSQCFRVIFEAVCTLMNDEYILIPGYF